ncbi:MAG: hypothetical protein HYX50_03360 [Chloroflexi bacterium]|nr:hypothetical protein [Chloroflexota bacterium]
MTTEIEPRAESVVYGDFADILKPETKWAIGGFPGWEYREPDAVVVVQNGYLRVAAVPLTRSNATLQILDNAKHMYFSRELFRVPEGGAISVELEIKAQKVNGIPDDFYDGFVSVNLLDFSTGLAVDFFVSNECFATVYARLPFPGTSVADAEGQKYFALFKEQPLPKGPQQRHHYKVTYDQGAAELRFEVEGRLVNRETNVPRMESFLAALGLMTEKDMVDGKSVSCHGQGLVGEWGPLTVTTTPAA